MKRNKILITLLLILLLGGKTTFAIELEKDDGSLTATEKQAYTDWAINAKLPDEDNWNNYWVLRYFYVDDIYWIYNMSGDTRIVDNLMKMAEKAVMGIKEGKSVCVHNKGNFGTNFGIYSYENGAHRPGFVDWPWEDDTPSAVGWCDWPWWYGNEYKTPRHIVVRLADLVARNGGLLLSMNPRPDGSLDKGQVDLLEGVGKWLAKNGEAIYGTRPWVIHAEGHVDPIFYTEVHPENGKKARPIQPNTDKFDASDIRFTTKSNTLYAIQLDLPKGGKTIIKSLGEEMQMSTKNKIKSIELLGYGKVNFKREQNQLIIDLPEVLPNEYAPTFKIEVKGDLIQRELLGKTQIIPMQT